MNRQEFMSNFRDDNVFSELTPEDREEIFLSVLTGSSDITVKLLQELCANYDVDNLEIREK